MSEQFQTGELVDITIKGARVVNSYQTRNNDTDTGTMLVVEHQAQPDYTPSGVGRPIAVNLAAPGVSVERVAPAEWPPQPGDVWRGRRGVLFFAINCDDSIDMRSEADSFVAPAYVLKNYSPLTLVYRRESDGGQS